MKENEINKTMRYWINLLSNIKSNESSTYFQIPMTHLNTMIIFNSITLLNTLPSQCSPKECLTHFLNRALPEIAFIFSPFWVLNQLFEILKSATGQSTVNTWWDVFFIRWTNTWQRRYNPHSYYVRYREQYSESGSILFFLGNVFSLQFCVRRVK